VPLHLQKFSKSFIGKPRNPRNVPHPSGAARGPAWIPASAYAAHVAEGVPMSDERYVRMMAQLLLEWEAAAAACSAHTLELETLRQAQQERLDLFVRQRVRLQAQAGQTVCRSQSVQ